MIEARRAGRRTLLRQAVLAAAALPATLAGCSLVARPGGRAAASPQAGGTFNTYVGGDLSTPDPQVSAPDDALVVSSISGYLLNFRAGADPHTYLDHDVESGIAASFETTDGVTWIAKLRPDARFGDVPSLNGRPVEAEDVKSSFIRAAGNATASRGALAMIDADRIETPSRDTVVFRLHYAYGPFRTTVAGPGAEILPREALAGASDPARVAIGCGPFVLEKRSPDSIVLRKNPRWLGSPRPYIESVRASTQSDSGQRLSDFTTGKFDEIRPSAGETAIAQKTNPHATVLRAPDTKTAILTGHMNVAASPFRDVRVRRALSMAIDRSRLERLIFNNDFVENGVLPAAFGKWALPPAEFGDAGPYYGYDLNTAMRLVDESGASSTIRRLLYPSNHYGPAFTALAQAIVPMLNAAGFKIQAVPIDYTRDFIGSGSGVLSGNYPLDSLVLSNQATQSSAEETLVANLSPGGQMNRSQVNDPALSDMLAAMQVILDDGTRLKAVRDIQRYVAAKVYLIPLPNSPVTTLIQPWVRNYWLDSAEGVGTLPNLWLKK
jgi:peptide/nickel transport system substrate-binding protein